MMLVTPLPQQSHRTEKASQVPSGPLVTIAIPTYNRAPLLRNAISSALAQTHANLEIIVSDNASTDGTQDVVNCFNDPRIRSLHHADNVGLVANWQAALSAARGEFFLMLSDDDSLTPSAVSDLLKPFNGLNGNEIAFVYGCCDIEETRTATTRVSQEAPTCEESADYRIGYLRGHRINYPSATLFRTSDIRELGGYVSHGQAPIDIGLAFAASGLRKYVAHTGTITTHYLFHPDNFTSAMSIEVQLDSVCALADTACSLSVGLSSVASRATKRAADWAKASALGYALVQHHLDGKISLRRVTSELWRRRQLFVPFGCRFAPAKIAIRLALFHVFGIRSLSIRDAVK